MHIVAIGGSDAGISAALRAREVDPGVEFTVVCADAYPNFSICGIPYYVSGEVTHWRNLAHRTYADLEAISNRTANALLVLGVRPGTKVIWCGPNSPEVIAVMTAARKVGAVAVPLNYRLTADDFVWSWMRVTGFSEFIDPCGTIAMPARRSWR